MKNILRMKNNFETVEEYIATFPLEVQDKMNKIRNIILENAVGCVEGISYKMPAYKLKNIPLIYFAGYKNHIGLYATPSGHERFAKVLGKYKQGKGSVQFPFDEIPYNLIDEIIKFRVDELNNRK